VLLHAAAVRVACPLWSWLVVPLQGQGAAVKVVCALWSWHVGANAGCRCRVLLSDFSQKQQEA